jgi:cell division protein FtsW
VKLKQRIYTASSSDNFDYSLLFIAVILVILGSIMVFSSSVIMADARFQSPYTFVIKQLMWVILGSITMYVLANFDYRNLQKMARILMVISLVLLLMVLVIGTVKGGARRWLRFGPISFQPSEIAKLVMVVTLADYIDRKKSRLKELKGLVPPLLIIGSLCGLIGLEPDLGTPILIVLVGMCLLYAAGTRFKYIFWLGLGAIPVIIVEILRKPYRLVRMRNFLSSWGNIHSGSYQLNQSILALGNGGFLGRGLGQSQMKLNYLPEPHTDFIFPIIGEELGFIGTVFVITLFLLFFWRGMKIARTSQDLFGELVALGITWAICFQAVLNMGVAAGVLPTKGLPLPFVSFGGTSLLLNMACVGILLNISKKR